VTAPGRTKQDFGAFFHFISLPRYLLLQKEKTKKLPSQIVKLLL
jgi:hypothetical protein